MRGRLTEGIKTELHEEKLDDCFFFYICASVERLGLVVLVKSKHLKGQLGLGLELWNRILKSLINVGCPRCFKSFLQGRKPLLLWSF